MITKLILNTPCLPKSDYHCGNAISQLISDIIYRYFVNLDNADMYYYVHNAWNLHGLPFEKMFVEHKMLNKDYDEIKSFAKRMIKLAQKEKEVFSNFDVSANEHIIDFMDTDEEFMRYCVNCFLKMKDKGFVELVNDEFCLNLDKFFKDITAEKFGDHFKKINIMPSYHRKTILAIFNELNGFYPLTKSRVFSPSFVIENKIYYLNPIFQSLVYPCYISKKYRTNYPAFSQVSSCGHSMLKWHYLRNVVSLILVNDVFSDNLILHGSILGTDGQPMSKHKKNVIKPSDLMRMYGNKIFVRYILIKSISENDIPLQIDLAKNEYQKIASKLDLIKDGRFFIKNAEAVDVFFELSTSYLKKFKIKFAFEQFYIGIKKSEIVFLENNESNKKISRLFKSFFD